VYEDVNFNFYKESKQVSDLNTNEVKKILFKYDIRVYGDDPPKPIITFNDLLIDANLLSVLKTQNYFTPTPIQMAALPCALAGRDLIGIAKTGSGKTLAYILPMIMHVLDQVWE
jgi:superfamily II DNA/RNA helicase